MEETPELQEFHIPFLRLKRPHTKSRLGCMTCKRKRVKCDETRPFCNRCRYRGLDCVYRDKVTHAAQRDSTTENATLSLAGATNTANPLTEQVSNATEVRDIELARYYFEHAVHTVSQHHVRREHSWVWKIFIPTLAYTSLTIRHGMLTLAAICLHFHHGNSMEHSSKYLEAAEVHGEIFVTQSRQQLLDLHASDVDSNLASSRMLCVLAFAFLRHYRRIGIDFADDASWTWLHLLIGVKTVFESIRDSGQEIDPMIMRDMIPEIPIAGQSYDFSCDRNELGPLHPLIDVIGQSRFERFKAFHVALNENWFSLEEQESNDMLAAINHLFEVTEHIYSENLHSLFRAICSWPAHLSKGFVDMLTNCVPAALAVHSHWLLLVVLAEDLWWVGDMGRAGIRAIDEICGDTDPGFRALIKRPLQILDLV